MPQAVRSVLAPYLPWYREDRSVLPLWTYQPEVWDTYSVPWAVRVMWSPRVRARTLVGEASGYSRYLQSTALEGKRVKWIESFGPWPKVTVKLGPPNGEAVAETTVEMPRILQAHLLGLYAVTGEAVPEEAEQIELPEHPDQPVEDDYVTQGKASLPNLKTALKHLRGFFGGWHAVDIITDALRRYIREKEEEGYSNGYIRRHLSNLKRAFNLAVQAGHLSNVPHFPTLKVDNVRKKFLTMGDVDAICEHLGPDLEPVVRFAAYTGWRKGEIIALKGQPGLRWRQVDFQAGTVHLDPGQTKNDEGRTFPFSALPPLEGLLRDQRKRTDEVERNQGQVIPHVFHRDGKPIKWMRHAWTDAVEEAGVPDAWFHDLRRTAVRNLERAGVSRSVATKLTGHKTESVYRRYAIADESALEEGVQKLARLHDEGGGEERTAVSIDEAREEAQ